LDACNHKIRMKKVDAIIEEYKRIWTVDRKRKREN